MQKYLLIIFLLLCAVGAFGYTTYQFQENKEEIVIQLSDMFEQLALPYRILKLTSMEPDTELLIPIQHIPKSAIADTWGDPRSQTRTHEGVDIFAKKGTPVFSATEGYVIRSSFGDLGGNFVFVVGKGGVRYYYAHLDAIAEGIESGVKVTEDTVLGFVGTTGNATGTPPHLHFGMYKNGAQDPYDMLVPRN